MPLPWLQQLRAACLRRRGLKALLRRSIQAGQGCPDLDASDAGQTWQHACKVCDVSRKRSSNSLCCSKALTGMQRDRPPKPARAGTFKAYRRELYSQCGRRTSRQHRRRAAGTATRRGCWMHLRGIAVGLLRKHRAWQRLQDVVACIARVDLHGQPHGLHRRHLLFLACVEDHDV